MSDACCAGVAACAIAGTTFASFLGLNISSYANGKAAAERYRYCDLGKRWRSVRAPPLTFKPSFSIN